MPKSSELGCLSNIATGSRNGFDLFFALLSRISVGERAAALKRESHLVIEILGSPLWDLAAVSGLVLRDRWTVLLTSSFSSSFANFMVGSGRVCQGQRSTARIGLLAWRIVTGTARITLGAVAHNCPTFLEE